MKKCIIPVFMLVMVFSAASRAQVLWRSAKTLSGGSLIFMNSTYLTPFDKSYSWSEEKWNDYPDGRSMQTWGFHAMIGYGITNWWEIMVHVPVDFMASETGGVSSKACGLGDIWLKTRIALLPWSMKQCGLTLIGAARFGTGDQDAKPALGDGTTDFTLGTIFSTRWLSRFRFHIKGNYWLNGRNEGDADIGDEMKGILKMDFHVHQVFMPFLTCIYYAQKNHTDKDGVGFDPRKDKSRYYLSAGGVLKPVKGLFIRPKITLPLGGEGGSLFTLKPLLELWYTFKAF